MKITIDAGFIVIILVALLFLCYFVVNIAYKIGFNDGLKTGKMIGKPGAMSEVIEDGNY
jgi:hypothetical protein